MARSRKPQRRRTPTKRAAPPRPAPPADGGEDPVEPTTAAVPAPDPDATEETPVEAPGAGSTDDAQERAAGSPDVEQTPAEEPVEAAQAADAGEEAPGEPAEPVAADEPSEAVVASSAEVDETPAEPAAAEVESTPEAESVAEVEPTPESEAGETPVEEAAPEAEAEAEAEDGTGPAGTQGPGEPEDEVAPPAGPPATASTAGRSSRRNRRGRTGRPSPESPPPAVTGAPPEPEPVAEEPEPVVAVEEAPSDDVEPVAESGTEAESGEIAASVEADAADADLADEATAADAESGDEDDGDVDDRDVAPGTSRQRALRAALATLPVPEPGPGFWADIDRALAELAPLSITARPAIRPITEPPPLSQPSLSGHLGGSAVLVTDDGPVTHHIDDEELDGPQDLGGDRDRDRPLGGGKGGGRGGRDPGEAANPFARFSDASRANSRRTAIVAIVLVLVILIVGNALKGDSGDDPSGAETAGPDEATTTAPSTTPSTQPTTTLPAIPGLDAAARLTPNGLGPLGIGTTLRAITDAGVRANVDQPTFATSGGACYDVKLAGAPDLTLRFRSPDPDSGVADAQEGELASIAVTIAPGSARVSEAGVALGATEDQVREAHGGNVEVSSHPVHPGGHMMVSYAEGGRGIAYGTDGRVVTEILVGYTDVITQRQGCS